jgi:hypothetical protein
VAVVPVDPVGPTRLHQQVPLGQAVIMAVAVVAVAPI